ncbi:MAG: hypothetical protein GXP04_01320 [Alphaproteobacteria bacterium]|nr:hypothetical protein [Alphaproteobacteria bacterium]
MQKMVKALRMLTVLMIVGAIFGTLIVTFRAGLLTVYGDATLVLDGLQGEAFFNLPERIIAFLSRVVFILGLYRLWLLFGEFSAQRYFSTVAIGHLRAFAGFFALGLALQIGLEISSFLWHDDSLEADHAHAFNISQLFYLIFSLIFFMIGHILGHARENEEELDSYF